MNNPANLKYTKSHEWVEMLTDTTARVGITDFAQESLGDLVFINLPEVGAKVEAGEAYADVESVKAVSDVFCPVSGVVAKVNEDLLDAPEMINEDPYEAWIAEIEDITDKSELFDAGEYEKICAAE